MYAYNKEYLYHVRTCLAFMFDCAVHTYQKDISDFADLFAESEYAWFIENFALSNIAGTSGSEMAYYILQKQNPDLEFIIPGFSLDRSPEYWMGHSLAYYQWHEVITFREIFNAVPPSEILDMYPVFHEMDISSFVAAIDKRLSDTRQINRLQAYRMRLGLSQSELSKRADVPLRTIQQYEQGHKSLAKANATYVCNLSRALYCRVEDLL